MIDKYRRDGTPYPEGINGLLEWGEDIENSNLKIVKQDTIGHYFISTIWLGLDNSFGGGKPLIFETMVFDRSKDRTLELNGKKFKSLGRELEQIRYSTEEEAIKGHEEMVKKYGKTIS